MSCNQPQGKDQNFRIKTMKTLLKKVKEGKVWKTKMTYHITGQEN